jgi:DNA-binding transcriptional regulator YiaG
VKRGTKYVPLFDHLRRSGEDEVAMTFSQIEALLGEGLPPSARARRGWWGNRSSGSPQASAWMGAAYHVEEVDLEQECVTFRKPIRPYNVRREGDIVRWDAELVKALRAHAGWSQEKLSEELQMRQQTISDWETGKYEPSRHTCKLLTLVAEQAGFQYGEEKDP